MFPNLRVLAYLDVPWDPVMITMLKAIYNENYRNRLQRHRLELYQSIDSLEKLVIFIRFFNFLSLKFSALKLLFTNFVLVNKI